MLSDAEFKEVQDIAKADRLKIVAMDGRGELARLLFKKARFLHVFSGQETQRQRCRFFVPACIFRNCSIRGPRV